MSICNFLFLYRLISVLTYFVIGTFAHRAILDSDSVKGNEFMYQVSLQIRGHGHHCGGGIIDDYFILTAAHCVVKENGHIDDSDNMSILAGTNNICKIGKRALSVKVKKIFVPEGYHPEDHSANADIAVLKLARSLELGRRNKRLRRLQLPKNKYETYSGKTVKIAGFGWDWIKMLNNDKFTGNNTDGHLRFANAVVLKFGQSGYPPMKLPDRIMSVRVEKYSKPSGTCFGDSGGPLVYDGKTVIGVLAISSFNCSEGIIASIYTRVSHYLDFIEHSMHENHH